MEQDECTHPSSSLERSTLSLVFRGAKGTILTPEPELLRRLANEQELRVVPPAYFSSPWIPHPEDRLPIVGLHFPSGQAGRSGRKRHYRFGDRHLRGRDR